MTNIAAIYTCLPVACVAVIIMAMAYWTKRSEPSCKYFLILCVNVTVWNVLQILYLASSDIAMSEMLFTMQMAAIPFTTVALLFYVLRFYNVEWIFQPKYIVLICIIPVMTVVINFTNEYHHLFRAHFEVLQAEPSHIIINRRGPWFWVHTLYSYALVVASCVISYIKLKSMPKPYRLPFYMVCLGCLSSSLFSIISVFFYADGPIDNTLFGLTFGLFFLYFAMDSSVASNYIIARNEVFEALNEYIFVLNMKGDITDINMPARTWLNGFNINSERKSFSQLLDNLSENGAIIEENNDAGIAEVFFPEKENSLFSSYSLKKQFIYDKADEKIGIIMTFSDITHMREVLMGLQDASSIDPLTGIYNRRVYEKALIDYDSQNFLPLSVVIGDVNGLKAVNDTLGHSKGDYLLRSISELLTRCAKDLGLVCRIGGDEFAIIIYGKSEDKIIELIESIRASFVGREEEMLGASIALGYAIKTNISQNLKNIIDTADKNMYSDKRNDRRRRIRGELLPTHIVSKYENRNR